MPDITPSVKKRPNWPQHLSHWLVPAIILLMAAGIILSRATGIHGSAIGPCKRPTMPTYERTSRP